MPELVIMGSANAIPTRERDNTYLTLHSSEKHILIDCGSNAWVRLMNSGITPEQLTDIIITHFHPDHVSGLPLLLMDLWLQGRKKPIVIHGLQETTVRIKGMMDLFGWENWPGFFEVSFAVIPAQRVIILEDSAVTVWANPVKHLIPTIGLRVENIDQTFSIAYTCDTEPCRGVDELALGADILIHESAGKAVGHSSPLQAGEAAARAEVDQLVLIHYPDLDDENRLIKDAKEKYSGKVILAKDGMIFRW
jgi:ribonuclease Z